MATLSPMATPLSTETTPVSAAEERFAALSRSTAVLRADLGRHPLYNRLSEERWLRAFMETHVFAVWDFMTLLKSLQRGLTCVSLPWVPPADRLSARLINEIVLGEETDEAIAGSYTSHFELYLDAMDEVGASTAAARAFVARVASGISPEAAFAPCGVPGGAAAFTRVTLRLASGPVHAAASAFLLGREDVIPLMFTRVIEGSGGRLKERCPLLLRYLERHIELDGGEHSDLGRRLLMRLCGDDAGKWADARAAAEASLTARRALWDSVSL